MGETWRAQFDVELQFQNGGRLEAQEFRLDIPGNDISEDDLGELFVSELGLLMVGEVRIARKQLIREPHKGLRTTDSAAGRGQRKLVELSHGIRSGMITYPGLPGPVVEDYLTREDSRARYAPGTEFQIGHISMVANTGTYLDAPSHRYPDGKDLSGMPLAAVADLDGVVIRVQDSGARAVDRQALVPHDVRGHAVLVHTGWDRHFGTERYGVDAPFLTRDASAWLADQGVALVGIDSVNIDDMGDLTRPTHTILLAAGIPIVEHLCGLEQLPPRGFRFHAAPPLVHGMGTFPVRAYAVVES